jgi:hypothetical protein
VCNGAGFGLSLTTFELACHAITDDDHSNSHSNSHTVDCVVRNTGAIDGDEVVMVFHSAGAGIRARIGTTHPVPIRTLVGFERVRVLAGKVTSLRFVLGEEALWLVNVTGGRQLYAGAHTLLFSRGHGVDVAVNVTVGLDEYY